MLSQFYGEADVERFCACGQLRDKPDERTPFQIDRDRVVFSFAFRRLQSKTQVFQSGEYDFYRTRLTHSIEVARVARSICDHLHRNATQHLGELRIDPDLVEAIGLSHDLGHPPFGHVGERKLNELMRDYGGFEGNAQTLRILTDLIWEHPGRPDGMQPTRAFMDGVLKYKALWTECYQNSDWQPPSNHFLYDAQEDARAFVLFGEKLPFEWRLPERINKLRSIECQVMDWADDTAYCLHDIVDGVKAGYISLSSVATWLDRQEDAGDIRPTVDRLLKRIREDRVEISFAARVGSFIRACQLEPVEPEKPLPSAQTQRHRWRLCVDDQVCAEASIYKRIANDLIFRSSQLQQIEFKGGMILEKLFNAIAENYLHPNRRPLRILPDRVEEWIRRDRTESDRARRICDFLAACTDAEAIRLYKRLFDPDFATITEL